MSMKLDNVHDLFVVHLKDLYSAETQLTKALPLMAQKASTPKLKEGFEMHLEQTEEHVRRLEQIAQNLNIEITGHACKAMQGLIEESSEFLNATDANDQVRDAALIACAQKVEHYEISAYGTAAALADEMDHQAEMEILLSTLKEERETDEKLTLLSKDEIEMPPMEDNS